MPFCHLDKLSIDSYNNIDDSEVIFIPKYRSMISSRSDIVAFLEELKDAINNDCQMFFNYSKKNQATLLKLDYDESDIMRELLSLRIQDYSETVFDTDNSDPPLLFVFGKMIMSKEVYIKLKVRVHGENKTTLCISFHFSEHSMLYPYQ